MCSDSFEKSILNNGFHDTVCRILDRLLDISKCGYIRRRVEFLFCVYFQNVILVNIAGKGLRDFVRTRNRSLCNVRFRARNYSYHDPLIK